MQRTCPGCPQPLARFSLRGRYFYSCADHGLLVAAANLRGFFKSQELAEDCLSKLNKAQQAQMHESHRRCPECAKSLFTFTAQTFGRVYVDVCPKCQVFWFDQGEWEAVKASGFYRAVPISSLAAQGFKISATKRNFGEIEEATDWLSAIIPVEESQQAKSTSPLVTVMILVFSFLATAMARERPGLIESWAYLPEAPLAVFRHFTALALHASLFHWLMNSVFLWIAGDDVEDEAGHSEFIKLFLCSGIAGHLLYTWIGGERPSVGMSGAVSGVLMYYGIRFPHHRIRKMIAVPWRFKMHRFQLNFSASTLVILYVAQTLFGLWLQAKGGPGAINYAAHLGGLACGLVFALLRRSRPRF